MALVVSPEETDVRSVLRLLMKPDKELLSLVLVLLSPVLVAGGGGGGGAFVLLDRLARSCWTLWAAVCAVVVLPD